jgi:hypothetical protein
MKYNGEEYNVMPFIFDLLLTTGSAAIARDLGALVVKQMVFKKAFVQHLFSTTYARMRRQDALNADGKLFADAYQYGRNSASMCPKRLPFSVFRIGLIVALYDTMRASHARRWCTKLRDEKLPPPPKKPQEEELDEAAKKKKQKQWSVSLIPS